MKRIALIALITSLALGPFAAAADGQKAAQRGRQAATAARSSARPAAAPARRSAQPVHSQRSAANIARGSINRSPRFNADVSRRPGLRQPDYTPRSRPDNNQIAPSATTAYQAAAPAATTNARSGANRRGEWAGRRDGSRDGNWRNGNGDGRGRGGRADNDGRGRDGDHTGRGRHHDGNHSGWHGHHDRTHHHHHWWTSRYSRFAFFGGGFYYWNLGFWYPAYGYDPYYSTYAYDAPIYGYNDQQPGQVMANVQSELARRGFYYGAIDSTYGPQTRAALVRFQQSTGLAQTGMIDEPTLRSLGLY